MAKPETLKRVLERSGIGAEIIDKINNGYEDVTDKSDKKKKARYLFHAVNVLDGMPDAEKRRQIMEACACTIGSSVEKAAERFAKKTRGLPLNEKIRLLAEIKHLGTPVLQDDNTILVSSEFVQDGVCKCPCPQISGVEITGPVSLTYCMCCAGHYKYQYEKALGVNVEVKQISSSLESMGKQPCAFVIAVTGA